MYCECFAKGATCGKECGCTDCSNVDDNSEEVDKARVGILKRNPQAFEIKVKETAPGNGFG